MSPSPYPKKTDVLPLPRNAWKVAPTMPATSKVMKTLRMPQPRQIIMTAT